MEVTCLHVNAVVLLSAAPEPFCCNYSKNVIKSSKNEIWYHTKPRGFGHRLETPSSVEVGDFVVCKSKILISANNNFRFLFLLCTSIAILCVQKYRRCNLEHLCFCACIICSASSSATLTSVFPQTFCTPRMFKYFNTSLF